MKRYMALLKDMESAGYMTEDPEGDWVRYEDVALDQAGYREGVRIAQAAAKACHEELEALKLRVAKAIVTLSSAGYWSEFARRALKELRGGQ